MDKQEYTLDDVQQKNRENPRHFQSPTEEEIAALQPGDEVRLIFRLPAPRDDGLSGERMWVRIASIDDQQFTGELQSKPAALQNLQPGDSISFGPQHIATVVVKGKAPFDEDKLAIVTEKTLEAREINWVVRAPETDDEQDSGWRLFYGDEEEDYLQDPDNLYFMPLEEVLQFEPKLETVFAAAGGAFQYSAEQNAFVAVKDWQPPEQ